MNANLHQIKSQVYDTCKLEISNFKPELESKAYDACHFELNGKHIRCRSSKITPKKVGQFVTFWKRNHNGSIEPFHNTDPIDFYVINVRNDKLFGQFVFPKSILIKKGLLSTASKEGKRGFRVYPSWDVVNNRQAEHSQKWQLDYFYTIDDATDFIKVSELYTAIQLRN